MFLEMQDFHSRNTCPLTTNYYVPFLIGIFPIDREKTFNRLPALKSSLSITNRAILVVIISLSLLNTSLLILEIIGVKPWSPAESPYNHSHPLPLEISIPAFLQTNSPITTPICWATVVGAWIWSTRKTKAQWARLGIDKDLFKLLTQMKGSTTRTLLLKSLSVPKDRSQLAKDLSLDWSTIDYQIEVLLKHKLVTEKSNYGQVRVYELSPLGMTLLKVLEDFESASNRSKTTL